MLHIYIHKVLYIDLCNTFDIFDIQ